jgi:hypothetical protein
MPHYVGCIRAERLQGARVACRGYDMDNGRAVRFLASPEALAAYFGNDDEDACIVVDDNAITWMSRRDGGGSLWSCAGLT